MLNLWGWMAQSESEDGSDEEETRRRQQEQLEAYTKRSNRSAKRSSRHQDIAAGGNRKDSAPRKPENSGGSAGVMRSSKSTKIKAFLGIDKADDEFMGGKINSDFRYTEPRAIIGSDRIIEDISDAKKDDDDDDNHNATKKSSNNTSSITSIKTNSKNDNKSHTNNNQTQRSTSKTKNEQKSDFQRPRNTTSFDLVKAQNRQNENEEDEILTDMTSILSTLATNSNTIQHQLNHQSALLSDTKRLVEDNLTTMDKLQIQMDKLIEKSNCSHYTVILIEIIVFIILLGLIAM